MKDYYKRLRLDETASEPMLRKALSAADPKWRRDGEYVLLDPKRRAVYDRDRRLLVTMGELRMHLGLNYTRFWARQDYKDFVQNLVPAEPARPAGRRVDPMMIAGAIRVVGRHGRRHAARVGGWWIALTLVVLLLLAAFLWYWARSMV